MNLFQMIAEFHTKYELTYTGVPRTLDEELSEFRVLFMREEWEEYVDASASADLEGQLDALVDLVYVALGTAYLHGFDFNEAFKRVHEANMKKVRAVSNQDSKRGTTYDVVKPEGWEPPVLTDLAYPDEEHRRVVRETRPEHLGSGRKIAPVFNPENKDVGD